MSPTTVLHTHIPFALGAVLLGISKPSSARRVPIGTPTGTLQHRLSAHQSILQLTPQTLMQPYDICTSEFPSAQRAPEHIPPPQA